MAFNVWATLLTKEGLDQLVATMIDKNCTVSPLGDNGKIGVMGETACLLAIKVEASWKNISRDKQKTKLLDFIKSCCDDLDVHYFSIVVTDVSAGGSTWAGEAPGNRQK